MSRLRARDRYELPEGHIRHLRAHIFRRDDFVCQICGARPHPHVQEYLRDRYKGYGEVPVYKDGQARRLSLDHIIPVSAGGHPSAIENLRAACASPCNSHRDHSLPVEGGLRRIGERPPRNLSWKKRKARAEFDWYSHSVIRKVVFRGADFQCSVCKRSPFPAELWQMRGDYDGKWRVFVRYSEEHPKPVLLMAKKIEEPGDDASHYIAICAVCAGGELYIG